MANKKRLLLPESNGIELEGLIIGANSLALEVLRKLTRINFFVRNTCSEVLPYINAALKNILDTASLPKSIRFTKNPTKKS